jgi:hypothetical protein
MTGFSMALDVVFLYTAIADKSMCRDWPSKKPIIGRAGCCTRAAIDATVAPPSNVMNSRRFIGFPQR